MAKGTAKGFIFLKDWLVITSIAVLNVCRGRGGTREREGERGEGQFSRAMTQSRGQKGTMAIEPLEHHKV